jgi:hypothetical protein
MPPTVVKPAAAHGSPAGEPRHSAAERKALIQITGNACAIRVPIL